MNTLKINYMTTGCCNHLPIHTVSAVSLVAGSEHTGPLSVPYPCRHAASRAAFRHTSAFLSHRWLTGDTRSRGARRPVTAFSSTRCAATLAMTSAECLTDPPAPSRLLRPPFYRPRVLALGYGALRPSYRSEPGIVYRSTKIVTPDTLVASIMANGGYRLFAAHFAAGHGASLCSTLRV